MSRRHRIGPMVGALVLAAAACGGGGDATEAGAPSGTDRPAEDADNPTPAPPLPRVDGSCGAAPGAEAARRTFGSLPATATLDRIGPTSPDDLAASGRVTVGGTVTAVEVGARSEATMGDYVAALGDAPLTILTVDLMVTVDRAEGTRAPAAGAAARVPIVASAAGPQPEEQLALVEEQARHDVACAVEGLRVEVLATAVTPGRTPVVALPRLLWATDPAAIAVDSAGGLVSADPMVTDAGTYFG